MVGVGEAHPPRISEQRGHPDEPSAPAFGATGSLWGSICRVLALSDRRIVTAEQTSRTDLFRTPPGLVP
jgi:hypothetical protein